MKKYILIAIIFSITLSCKENKDVEHKSTEPSYNIGLEQKLSVNKDYSIGDVRRYGVMPDQGIGVHPVTKNRILDELVNLANTGVELVFPEGYYKMHLDLAKANNATMVFNDAKFSGAILINGTKDNNIKNVTLKGKIGTYHGLSTRFINGLELDSIILLNDKSKNLAKFNNTGANFYVGSKNVECKYLQVDGTGSNLEVYRYNFAALAIHGKTPPPENLNFKNILINSSDTHGAFLSGKDIIISNIIIKSFGDGTSKYLNPINFTTKGEESQFSGIWLNDFNYSAIDNASINTSIKKSKIINALYLDKGNLKEESEIVKLKIIGDNKTIKLDKNTNVIQY